MVTDLQTQIDLVRDYVNTLDFETGIDRIATADELAMWLSEQGLVEDEPEAESEPPAEEAEEPPAEEAAEPEAEPEPEAEAQEAGEEESSTEEEGAPEPESAE